MKTPEGALTESIEQNLKTPLREVEVELKEKFEEEENKPEPEQPEQPEQAPEPSLLERPLQNEEA